MAKAKTQTEAAPVSTAGVGKKIGNFTVKRLVTLPLWKWVDGQQKAFRIESPIILGKTVANKGSVKEEGDAPAKVKMEPAHICNVTNLETGESMQMIVGAVLKGNLEEGYPDQGYVGKCFLSIQSKIEGKRYKGYSLAEIDDPAKA